MPYLSSISSALVLVFEHFDSFIGLSLEFLHGLYQHLILLAQIVNVRLQDADPNLRYNKHEMKYKAKQM